MTTTMAAKRLIRLPEVLRRVGLSKSTLYAKIRRGEFPKPVELGSLRAWVEDEVDQWISAQIERRDKAA